MQVRYESRRRLAETRPRVRGQFVKGGSEGDQTTADFQEQVRTSRKSSSLDYVLCLQCFFLSALV